MPHIDSNRHQECPSSGAVSTSHGKGCLGNGETPAGERGRRDPGLNAVREEALKRKRKFD
ncbi:hypothetical protein GCM10011389_37430 [Pontibacillus salipaludis]|uniref:Uncharacterized protein n=1 Tax=Pontibacillus salipaludis TaxID=1697394 RepID=A0ABQ1QFY7_9BACI|nr:hypothetical protein GCM10011389_37430 [Pontibacillus salipaludis]